MNRRN